jgi:hypothetical protein
VLIGTTGLSPEDLSPAATPAIWRLLDQGADAAAMANRSVRVGSCPAEGWLAVGAGARIGEVARTMLSDTQGATGTPCRNLAEPVGGRIPDWAELTAAAVESGTAESIGSLARWLADQKIPAAAIGPGAALALASGDGVVQASYTPAGWSTNELADAAREALARGSQLIVVDVGVRSSELTPTMIDQRIGAVVGAMAGSATGATTGAAAEEAEPGNPGPGVEIVLASLADWTKPTMGLLLDWAPDRSAAQSHLLESSATKTAGLVLATDLAQVIGSRLLAVPFGPVDPWSSAEGPSGAPAVQVHLADLDRHAVAARQWSQLGWIMILVVAALGIFGPLIALRGGANTGWRLTQTRVPEAAFDVESAQRGGRRTSKGARQPTGEWLKDSGRDDGSGVPRGPERQGRGRRGSRGLVEYLALAAAAFPAAGLAANALPWWRAGAPLIAWAACGAGFALFAAACAVATRRLWRGGQAASPLLAPGVIGLLSAVVVGLDPFVDRIFIRDAPLGYQTLLAVRVYGYPNSAFAVFATGAILATVLFAGGAWAKAKRTATVMPIIGIGLVALILDAYPSWGADLGGAVGIGGAFVVLALSAADVRVNWKWVLAALAAGAAAAAAMAFLDYRRGPERWTHLGRFVQTVADGGLGDVLLGKGLMWLRLSVGPILGLALAALVCRRLARAGAFDGLKARSWSRVPLARPVLAGLVTLWVVGSLVNDSGLVVAVAGLATAGPAAAAGLTWASLRRSRAPAA